MTVLYLAQQKSSILSHTGSHHSNSNISFWSPKSSMTIVVKCYFFPHFFPHMELFLLLFYLFMMCSDRVIDKSKVEEFLFTAAMEGNDLSCFITSEESASYSTSQRKFCLWLCLSFGFNFRCQVFLYFRDTDIRDSFKFSTQCDEALIWAVERTKFTSKSPPNTCWVSEQNISPNFIYA